MTHNGSLKNGYHLPVKGLDNGFFYPIHLVALTSITISFVCAAIVFTLSMRKTKPFFQRSKSERFVVYLAICDGMFNIFHSMDHAQYVITQQHPGPPSVCAFYSFMMYTFVVSQMLLVNVIAINAFFMIYFGKNLYFGKYDYRVLVFIFGVPISILIVSVSLNKLGPNGYFCSFDGVTGNNVQIAFTTAPSLLILIINSILYFFIWRKIKIESERIQNTIGNATSSARATHQAAKTMTLFILMFTIQWFTASVFGVWQLVDDSPPMLVLIKLLFANAGGILNGIVYFIIYKQKMQTEGDGSTEGPTHTSRY